ncbi:MAG: hypothetical protein ACRC14_15115 [Paracoccaceae bacterium]
MRQVHFHIGDRKTGTSSLQSVLDTWDRSGAALASGVLYPKAGRHRSDQINHRNLAHELGGDPRFTPAHGTWTDLAQNLVDAPEADHILVSSESFENVDPKLLLEALRRHLGDGVEPVILCYFRPHMSRLLASYTQNAKRGLYVGTLDGFVRKSVQGRLGQAFARLQGWRACFGANFRLSLYQRDRLLNGDIVADVLVRQMGLPRDLLGELPSSAAENRAPKPSTLATLMALRRMLGQGEDGSSKTGVTADQDAALTRLQARLDATVPAEPALQLDAETAARVHAACVVDARAIDAAFFADNPGVEAALDTGLATAQATVAWANPNDELNAAWVEACEALLSTGTQKSRGVAVPPEVPSTDLDDRRARRKRRRLVQKSGNEEDGDTP